MIEPETHSRFARELKAMARAAGDDPEAFAAVAALLDDAALTMRGAARELRDQGFSWTEIARPLGVTRQAAQQRYSDRL